MRFERQSDGVASGGGTLAAGGNDAAAAGIVVHGAHSCTRDGRAMVRDGHIWSVRFEIRIEFMKVLKSRYALLTDGGLGGIGRVDLLLLLLLRCGCMMLRAHVDRVAVVGRRRDVAMILMHLATHAGCRCRSVVGRASLRYGNSVRHGFVQYVMGMIL